MSNSYKLLFFVLIVSLSFSSVEAYDYEKSIALSELPFNFTQQFLIQANEDSTLTLVPSTSWLRTNNTYFLDGVDSVIINVSVNIPESVPVMSYDEFIEITTDYNTTSELTFHLNILNDTHQNQSTFEFSDLIIETRDFFTNDLLGYVSLRLTLDNVTFDGVTNSDGHYTYNNLEHKCFDLSLSKDGFSTDSRVVCLVSDQEYRTVYMINSSVDINSLPLDEQIEFQLKFLDTQREYLESLRRQEPEKVYINNTEYKILPVSPESFSKLLECDTSNLERLQKSWDACESNANYLRNQSDQYISENNNLRSQLNITKNNYDDEINVLESKTVHILWSVLLLTIVFICIVVFAVRNYVKSGGYIGGL